MKRLTERHFHMNAQRLVLTQRLSRKRCSLFTNTTIDLTWRKRFSVRTLSLYSRRVVARPSATEATEAVGNSEIVYYKLISFICTSHLISSSWSSGRGCFVYVLSATSLVSNGNNIVACNFARFAANDVKGQQVATANGASSVARDNSRASTLKHGHQPFVAPYSTDNRSIYCQK